MKRYKSLLSLKWVAALLLVVGFVSCADEEIIDSSNRVVEGVMTDVNFSFTSPTPAKVESRAAIPTLDEYKVHNLYVYVFDKAGKNGELFKFDYDQLKDKKREGIGIRGPNYIRKSVLKTFFRREKDLCSSKCR